MAHGRPALEEQFCRAAEAVRKNPSLKDEQKLEFYGLYKQANEGNCNTSKPSFFDFTGRAKWEAWRKLSPMTKEESMMKYIQLVETLDPAMNEETVANQDAVDPTERLGSGPVQSRIMPIEREDSVAEEDKTVFDWCKEGNVERLQAVLTPGNVDSRDEQGMTPLHWACDRGHLEAVMLLVHRGADMAAQDSDGQTPLHYASSCDQHDVVSFLLSNGADPSIKDCDENTPIQVANDPSTKQLFRQ